MEFREVLSQRRMVRSYVDEPVPVDALERIVASVRRAPSAGFSQGHRLVVVTARELRCAIGALLGEAWIEQAPAHVVHGVSEADYHRRYRQPDKLRADGTEFMWPVPYWFVDAGTLLMLVHLAAIDEGLAAGFVDVPVEVMRPFKELLGMPEDVAVIGRLDDWSRRAGSGGRSVDEYLHATTQAPRGSRPLGALEWESTSLSSCAGSRRHASAGRSTSTAAPPCAASSSPST